MHEPAKSLLILFLVVMLAPLLSYRLRLPVIVIEIIIGIALGALGWLGQHPTLDFFASFGLTYLLFLAGLEVDAEAIRNRFGDTLWLAGVSLLVPFATGCAVGAYFGIPPYLTGTLFCTTSLGIVLPMTREMKNRPNLTQLLLGSVILIDILSMFLLAFVLSYMEGDISGSFVYSVVAVLALFIVPWIANRKRVHEYVERALSKRIYFEREVRFAFALIFILGAVTESFGFHSIIGSFIAGLIISEITPESSRLEEKLHGFGYGFFIPLFFILVGANVDLQSIFSNLAQVELLAAVLVLGLLSKVISVGAFALARGFQLSESLALGFLHASRLSLIIAAAEIARKAGYIERSVYSIFVLLAVVTSVIGPSVTRWLLKRFPPTPASITRATSRPALVGRTESR